MVPTLLVIDDDAPSRRLVAAIFGEEGYRVVGAPDGPRGIASVASGAPDVVLLDMQMPAMDGIEVLEKLVKIAPQVPVVMLTAERDVRTVVKATRLGAYDYLTKPIDHDEVVTVVKRALETSRLRTEVEGLRKKLDEADGIAGEMGPSAQVREIVAQIGTVATADLSVLVLGETGTGKELVARAVHRRSERHDGPFVALDCGAIPEALLESELFGHERGAFTGADRKRRGRFALAEGGTLFLDEIGNLPLGLQAKLLRVLESKQLIALGAAKEEQVNIRFVAATNDDLEARVASGAFRADLYYRLAQYTITLPPLRQRRDDIAYLARRFLAQAGIELRRPVRDFAPGAIDVLERHPWPGNVRELRNVVRQAVIKTTGLVVEKDALRELLRGTKAPAMAAAPQPLGSASLKQIAEQAASAAEKNAIAEALRSTQGNKSRAARLLDTDYKTLHLKMKKLGLRGRDFQL